jgi:hypothetical protein
MMWLMLACALATAWRIESTRAATWRIEAEQLALQLETESLKQLAFNEPKAYRPASYDPPLRMVSAR